MSRQHRHHLRREGLHLLVRIGRSQHLEYGADARKHLARVIKRENCILKRGLLLVLNDGNNLLIMERHTTFKGGFVVLKHDSVEGRHTVRCLPNILEKWVITHSFLSITRNKSHYKSRKCE